VFLTWLFFPGFWGLNEPAVPVQTFINYAHSAVGWFDIIRGNRLRLPFVGPG